MSHKRFGHIKLDELKLDKSGFLRTHGQATRVGVFTYVRPTTGKVVREFRPAEEVFKADSMLTLKNVPVTDRHPDGDGRVHSKNSKDWQIGFTGNVEQSEPFVKAEIVITDQRGIDSIMSGRQELSCGYTCDYDETPGEFEGQPYDLIQRNIQYNHLAIVDRGRAGPQARIKLDSEDAIEFDGDDQKRKLLEDMKMKKITLGEKQFEVDEAVAAAIETELKKAKDDKDGVQAKLDSAESDKKKAEDKLKEVETKAEGLQAKVDAAQEKSTMKTDADEVKKLVRSRLNLERVAQLALGEVEKLDSMEDKEVKIAVIKADRKDFDEKDKTDAYIDAAFDIAAEQAQKKSREALGNRINEKGGDKTDSAEVRTKNMEDSKNAWKAPLSAHV